MEKLMTGKDSVREFIHDLKNPLLSIRLNAELLKIELDGEELEAEESFRSSYDSIVSEAERLEYILEHFIKTAVEE
ncbi:MAG: histidine kinase dimerization/phospho-acceptor domain-containing protein [bacterium]